MGSVTISTSNCQCCCAGGSVHSSVAFVSALTKGCSCGFPEYIPSSPFKIYRTRTMSGSETWVGNPCEGGSYTFTCNFSGTCFYDATTCAFTDNTVENCGGADVHFCSDLTGLVNCSRKIGTETSTSLTIISTNTCCAGGDGSGLFSSCNITATLTNEDKPADVIARGTTTAGTAGSAWGLIVDYTGAGCPAGQYGASKQSSAWTISFTGLVIGCKYTIVIYYTSPCGNSTETHVFTATATTDTLTGNIPQVDGCVTTWDHYTTKAGDP